MNSNKIEIIEFPSNLGLKKTESAIEPGVGRLPDWLRFHNFHEQINPESVCHIKPPKYSMAFDKLSGVRNADKIVTYAIKQSELLEPLLDRNTFKIIIGGDCSILIGNSLALKKKGEYGLFFLDGHTDFIWPEISQTGGAAGMDLAIVTGYGHEKLTNIQNLKPYFQEKNVFCVGNREYDQTYVRAILGSKVTYVDLNRLRNQELKTIVDHFLGTVRENKLDGFFIHLDVDVLNDNIMPAVDSRIEDGLNYTELSELLVPLLKSEKAVGIEITILDPDLDRGGKFTSEFVRNFGEILKQAKSNN